LIDGLVAEHKMFLILENKNTPNIAKKRNIWGIFIINISRNGFRLGEDGV
jgi:hypothetical protein